MAFSASLPDGVMETWTGNLHRLGTAAQAVGNNGENTADVPGRVPENGVPTAATELIRGLAAGRTFVDVEVPIAVDSNKDAV